MTDCNQCRDIILDSDELPEIFKCDSCGDMIIDDGISAMSHG